jgi:hypothetical protein
MRKTEIIVLASIAPLLAACAANAPRTVAQSFATVGAADEFAQEANAHDVPITVRGSGFGLDDSAFDAAVVARLQGNAWGANPRFTLDHGPNASKVFSIVMVIGAPTGTNTLALCAHADTTPPPTAVRAGDPLHVAGALCRFDKAVTGVDAYADAVSGTDDPRFGVVLAAAVRDLTREQRPNRFKRDD